jgi:NADH-quinone oxidoreductase subunit M
MGGFSEILWPQQASIPLLLILQILPVLGAMVVFALNERSTAVLVGKIVAFIELLLTIVALTCIDPTSPALQLAERFDGLGYHVAVDGISLVFLLVAVLLTFCHVASPG